MTRQLGPTEHMIIFFDSRMLYYKNSYTTHFHPLHKKERKTGFLNVALKMRMDEIYQHSIITKERRIRIAPQNIQNQNNITKITSNEYCD